MADSFYGELFSKISYRLQNRNAGKDPKPTKEGKPAKNGKPAKEPQVKGKGFVIGKTSVDLTPEAYKSAIEARALKKRWVFALGASLAFAALVTSSIFATSLPAKRDLDNELKNNTQLQTALGQYQEVNQAVDQMDITVNKLNLAAGGAIDWVQLISAVEATLPSGTSVSSIGINTAGNSADKGASLLISFTADSPLGYADTLRSVQTAPGVSNVQIGGMTSTETSYEFSATLDYDTSIRTGKFPSSISTGGN